MRHHTARHFDTEWAPAASEHANTDLLVAGRHPLCTTTLNQQRCWLRVVVQRGLSASNQKVNLKTWGNMYAHLGLQHKQVTSALQSLDASQREDGKAEQNVHSPTELVQMTALPPTAGMFKQDRTLFMMCIKATCDSKLGFDFCIESLPAVAKL